MAKAYVICPYCGLRFDRNSEPNVHEGRRYYHKACYPLAQASKAKAKTDYDELISACLYYYNNYFNYAFIRKQVNEMMRQGYTASGMLGTLHWLFDIRGENPHKMNTPLGLIPYNYDKAKEYYRVLAENQARQESTPLPQTTTRVITISPPKPKERKLRLFNVEVEEDNGGE